MLVTAFSNREWEITHLEIVRRDDCIEDLSICIEPDERTLSEFADYLQNHLKLIPDYKSSRSIHIGFSDVDQGTIRIQNSVVTLHPELAFLGVPSTDIFLPSLSREIKTRGGIEALFQIEQDVQEYMNQLLAQQR